MVVPDTWPGPPEQWAELVRIADENCKADPVTGCGEYAVSSPTLGTLKKWHTCGMHDALRGTNRASASLFRNLVLMRYLAPRLEAEELDETAWPGELKLSAITSGARG